MSTQDKTKHSPWEGLPNALERELIDIARYTQPYSQAVAEIHTKLAERDSQLVKALKAIVDSAGDGRSVPEWLEERLVDARAALKAAEEQK